MADNPAGLAIAVPVSCAAGSGFELIVDMEAHLRFLKLAREAGLDRMMENAVS